MENRRSKRSVIFQTTRYEDKICPRIEPETTYTFKPEPPSLTKNGFPRVPLQIQQHLHNTFLAGRLHDRAIIYWQARIGYKRSKHAALHLHNPPLGIKKARMKLGSLAVFHMQSASKEVANVLELFWVLFDQYSLTLYIHRCLSSLREWFDLATTTNPNSTWNFWHHHLQCEITFYMGEFKALHPKLSQYWRTKTRLSPRLVSYSQI